MRVGLLGGSFNPAHEGHLHISLTALRRLDLDQVWWLATPQNPLKSSKGMAPYVERLAQAAAMARHPKILVSDIERQLGTRFTADTLAALRARYPGTEFVWLMGADNFGQIHRWHRWQAIFETMPVAVFDRPPYRFKVLWGPAASVFAQSRVIGPAMRRLADAEPPAWTFFQSRLDPLSSTGIRHARKAAVAKGPAPAYLQGSSTDSRGFT